MDNIPLGVSLVVIGGLAMGCGAWPIKIIKKMKFEHFWFIGMLVGLVIVPWAITLTCCKHAMLAYTQAGWKPIIMANIFSFCWGIANVMCGICFVRIGVGLTSAVLTGMGASVLVILPMILKGTGKFADSPDITSHSGIVAMVGVGVMLLGVILSSFAGFGRARIMKQEEKTSGSFAVGLIMAIVAGVLSAGMLLSFVYGNGAIMAAFKAQGNDETTATFAVNAVGLLAGALVNIIYPGYLMTKNRSWGMLANNGSDLFLAIMIGVQMVIAAFLAGRGMLFLGAFGASIGSGIQQAMQMTGSQGLGFISGEWKGIRGKPIIQMCVAIVFLLVAAGIMLYAKNVKA